MMGFQGADFSFLTVILFCEIQRGVNMAINYFDNIDMRTDIIDDIPKKKNADESGRKEKDGFKYDIEKINKERKEMTPIIKE